MLWYLAQNSWSKWGLQLNHGQLSFHMARHSSRLLAILPFPLFYLIDFSIILEKSTFKSTMPAHDLPFSCLFIFSTFFLNPIVDSVAMPCPVAKHSCQLRLYLTSLHLFFLLFVSFFFPFYLQSIQSVVTKRNHFVIMHM